MMGAALCHLPDRLLSSLSIATKRNPVYQHSSILCGVSSQPAIGSLSYSRFDDPMPLKGTSDGSVSAVNST